MKAQLEQHLCNPSMGIFAETWDTVKYINREGTTQTVQADLGLHCLLVE